MSDDLLAKAKAKLDRELLDIESRPDLSDDKKVDQIIVIFSTACAAIAIQPIPFADFFILTPLQAYMGARLAAIRGVPLSEAQAAEIVKEIMGVVGMGLVAQQAGIAAAKIFFPIVGGVATLPVVFGLTYAIGKVMDFYLLNKAAGRAPNAAELKAAWKQAAILGKSKAKRHRPAKEALITNIATRQVAKIITIPPPCDDKVKDPQSDEPGLAEALFKIGFFLGLAVAGIFILIHLIYAIFLPTGF
ncbi:DUF697 domain-containing protein [Sphingomonas sp. C8-2]|nr:DUF697 domain-containing protein [Sphingomonas sp. Y57]QEH81144.1 DUF697 domain-containing protein [Sphingomonas sp. C8-2]